jgi:hypothetical protein
MTLTATCLEMVARASSQNCVTVWSKPSMIKLRMLSHRNGRKDETEKKEKLEFAYGSVEDLEVVTTIEANCMFFDWFFPVVIS